LLIPEILDFGDMPIMSEEILPKKSILPKIRIPLVDVSLPEIDLPEFPPKIPKLDDRQMDIVRYGIMDDLSDLVPVLGDLFSDAAYAEIKEKMKPEEYRAFVEENKWLPSSLAALKVFTERK
jgi:hypothetical protein